MPKLIPKVVRTSPRYRLARTIEELTSLHDYLKYASFPVEAEEVEKVIKKLDEKGGRPTCNEFVENANPEIFNKQTLKEEWQRFIKILNKEGEAKLWLIPGKFGAYVKKKGDNNFQLRLIQVKSETIKKDVVDNATILELLTCYRWQEMT